MSLLKLTTVVHRAFAFPCGKLFHVLSMASKPAATMSQQFLCIAGTCSKQCKADSTTTFTTAVSFGPREGQQTTSEQSEGGSSFEHS